MLPFDVYPLLDIEPISAQGCTVYDKQGTPYLDLYGGHAVISIGHTHPYWVNKLKDQLDQMAFYSNAVQNSLQTTYAQKLGDFSGYPDYSLFLCNSGSEANENALKLASFHTKKSKVLAFKGAFHGRTSGSVAVTDIPSYLSPFNDGHQVQFVPLNDLDAVEQQLKSGCYAAVIIEGLQGVSGIHLPNRTFLTGLRQLCTQYQVILILDEIQSGCGRTGKYFCHQHSGISADIITLAKGIGNGFPMAAVLIGPQFKAVRGSLGTTFGGNHLACTAGLAVIEVMQKEDLIKNADTVGTFILDQLKALPKIKELRGLGLMIGIELNEPAADVRHKLLFNHHIFTGSSGSHTIRLLPPLNLTTDLASHFIDALNTILTEK